MKRLLATIAVGAAVAGCGASTPTTAQRCHAWGVYEAHHGLAGLSVPIAARICRDNPKVLSEKR